MKKTLLAFTFALSFSALQAQLIYETNFSAETVNTDLNNQAGWSNNSNNSGGFPGSGACAGAICTNAKVVATPLTSPYNGYYGGVAQKSVSFTLGQDAVGHWLRGRGNALPDTAAFAAYPDGTNIYVSFLVRLTDAPVTPATGTPGQLFRFADKSVTVGMRLYAQKNANGAVRFGIEKNNGAVYSNYDFALNTTYLIVMKQQIIAGTGNDRVSLYVNPAGLSEPATPIISAVAGDDITIERMVIYQNQSTCPTGNFSAFRVARMWSNLGIGNSSTKELSAGSFSIKPTLATDAVTIETKNNIASTVNVSDMNGRVVCVAKLSANETQKTIDVSALSAGVYILQVANENGVAAQKFVKQ
ncbi:MAG: hypothetical protein RL757_691 [Bacteroidota bacterium]